MYPKLLVFEYVVTATLWLSCLLRYAVLILLVGMRFLAGGLADFFHICACTPLATVLLNRIAFKRRPLVLRDLWSVFNGIRMVWLAYGVVYAHPKVAKHYSYSMIIVSWSLTYIIHYTYHAFRLRFKASPKTLFWLQYHCFFLLMPISLVGEFAQIFLSLRFVTIWWYDYILSTALVLYIPIGVWYFSHLWNRKVALYDNVMERKRRAPLNAGSTAVNT